MIPTREEAFALLETYTQSPALLNHAQAVEGCMRYFASQAGQDEELWGVVGLLHDIDYERWPEQHCIKARELLEEAGVHEEIIRAVQSHGWGLCSDVQPQSAMEKTVYAVDEMTGLINAAALMRPSQSVLDMEPKSVKKKFKSKGFAAGVDRSVIEKGAAMLGMELDDLITGCLEGMKACAGRIGLG